MAIVNYPVDVEYMDIDVVMRSGQCFSIDEDYVYLNADHINYYKVLSADKICLVQKYAGQTSLMFSDEDKEYWCNYFGIGQGGEYRGLFQYKHYLESLKNSGDDFLKKCADYSDGLIILKQDLWETLVSFIISQRKSIPAIKTSLNRFRKKFGDIKSCEFSLDGMYLSHGITIGYHTFPTPEKIASLTSEDMTDLGMGYRSKYVLDAARWFCEHSDEVSTLLSNNTTHEERMDILKQINGVGDKVANCICLFALGDMTSFPVDVWIQRAIDKNLIDVDSVIFEDFKGFAQQVVFYYLINHRSGFKAI